jgi:hypothetical protein
MSTNKMKSCGRSQNSYYGGHDEAETIMANEDSPPRKIGLQTLASAIAAFPPPVSEPRPMSLNYFKTICAYCEREFDSRFDVTIDHVVPKWVMRALPDVRDHVQASKSNRAKTCAGCNGLKGSMPLSTFLQFRHDPRKLRAYRLHWDHMATMASTRPMTGLLAIRIRKAFLGDTQTPVELPAVYGTATKTKRPVWLPGASLLDEDYQLGKRV